MFCIEVRVDVTDQVALPGAGRVEIAASVYLPEPDAVRVPPLAMFASPGGGFSRKYFDMTFPGHTGYSEAEHHVQHGAVFVAYDHLGTGDSTVPAEDELTIEMLAHANDVAVRDIARRLENGTLTPRLAPLPSVVKIGAGQSMGGCVTIVMQGRHRTFDAIIVLGYSGLHTVPPFRDERMQQALIESTRHLNRDTDVRTLSIEEPTREHTPEAMRYHHHWEDVPSDILQADTPEGFPFRRSGNWSPAWRSATLPRCALIMLSPGCVALEAAVISVPVLTAMGERDVCPDPHSEPVAFRSSHDVTLFIVPNMAHMHNFASTRELLWNRIDAWMQTIAANLSPTAPTEEA